MKVNLSTYKILKESIWDNRFKIPVYDVVYGILTKYKDNERYIQEITDNYYVIRASWLYSKYNKNFVKTIVNKLQENMNLQIITTQTGTPTSCIDLSNFIYFLINNNVDYGVYHFSALGKANWYEFAKHIASRINHDLISKIKPVTNFVALAKRPKYSVLNNTKTQQIPYQQNDWKTSVNRILNDMANRN